MIRALSLPLLLCGGCATLERALDDPTLKVFASANAPPRYQPPEQRAALARAQAQDDAFIVETEARWKREAEAAAEAPERAASPHSNHSSGSISINARA